MSDNPWEGTVWGNEADFHRQQQETAARIAAERAAADAQRQADNMRQVRDYESYNDYMNRRSGNSGGGYSSGSSTTGCMVALIPLLVSAIGVTTLALNWLA